MNNYFSIISSKLNNISDSILFSFIIVFTIILPQFTELINPNIFKVVYCSLFVFLLIKTDLKGLSKKYLILGIYLLVILSIFLQSSEQFKYFKTISYSFIIFGVYYLYLQKARILSFFRVFIIFSVTISLFAIFQEILHLIKSPLFYMSLYKNPDFVRGGTILRVTSLFTEPSQLALFLLPSVLTGISSTIERDFSLIKIYEIVIVVTATLLTFSSVGYIGFAIGTVITVALSVKWNIKTVSLLALLMTTFCVTIYNTNIIREKLIATRLFGTSSINESVAASSIFAYTAFQSVKKVFTTPSIIGAGIGNYNEYTKDIRKKSHQSSVYDNGSNIGHSRLIVEIGLAGYLLFLLLLFFNKINFESTFHLSSLNLAFFLIIPITLLRIGFYTNPFVLFSIAILIQTKNRARETS